MQSLASLVPECAVRAFLIAICMGAVICVLRVKSARARHAVWTSVAVSMLALPVWTAWGPRAVVRLPEPVTAPAMRPATASTDTLSLPSPTPTPPAKSPAWNWRNLVACVYLLGFLALAVRLVVGTVRAHVLVRRAANFEGRLTSDSCAAPVTVGWLRPTVILPQHWRQWPPAQLRAVLTHEEEHARWRDPLVQWLALLNRAIFWFHPLAWWLDRRLSALSEEACDAAVLARGHDPFEYAEYLLEIARAMRRAGGRASVIGMAMPGAFLPRRIRRIMERRPPERLSRVRMACMAVACAAILAVFTAGAMDRSQAAASSPGIAERPAPAPVVNMPAAPHKHKRPKVLLAQALLGPAWPAARQAGGSISGTVEDPSGARVPGCTVVLHDQTGAEAQSVLSDAAGIYQFSSLPHGHYSVEYRMRGFANLRKEAEIEDGKPVRIDVQLAIAQTTTTLEVIGQKPVNSAPSAQHPAPEPGAISVGGRVEHAKLLVHTNPIYPPELRAQGIEGTVRLAAIISSDGAPVELRVLNTDQVDPRLAQAALDAVRQWRYQPTKLNEHPVTSLTNIDVIFQLGK